MAADNNFVLDQNGMQTLIDAIANKVIERLESKAPIDHGHAEGTTSSSGFISKEDKIKLNGIAEGANKYTHPASHVATMITQDATHRFVTDVEKSKWDSKAEADHTHTLEALGAAASDHNHDGRYYTESEMDNKLEGKSNSDHTHTPSAIGAAASSHTHASTDITQDATHRFVTDAEKTKWDGKADGSHTHTLVSLGAAAASHTHDDRYYTESEMDTKLSGKAASNHTHTASQVTQDSAHRFITDRNKTLWDNAAVKTFEFVDFKNDYYWFIDSSADNSSKVGQWVSLLRIKNLSISSTKRLSDNIVAFKLTIISDDPWNPIIKADGVLDWTGIRINIDSNRQLDRLILNIGYVVIGTDVLLCIKDNDMGMFNSLNTYIYVELYSDKLINPSYIEYSDLEIVSSNLITAMGTDNFWYKTIGVDYYVDGDIEAYGIVSAEQFNSTNGDYAEYWEWEDGNNNNEDRVGLFATFSGDKIRISLSGDDLSKVGIVSANPSLLADSDKNEWKGKYLKDVYGRYIYEETTDESGHILRNKVINPDYDPTLEYIRRADRPEWSYLGTHGKLVVQDDGTCEPDGFCVPKDGGIATASTDDKGFYVMARIDETHIKVYIK